MFVRIAIVAAVLATFVVLGMPLQGSQAFQPGTAAAAPAETWSEGIQFSTSVDDKARPEHPRTEFGSGTETVWASFEFRDHDPNSTVTVGIRANGEDYTDFRLNCCEIRNGRYAFPIRKRGGNGELPGAAYDVRVYVNGAEIAQGGFGVNGRGGLDNDGRGQGNDND